MKTMKKIGVLFTAFSVLATSVISTVNADSNVKKINDTDEMTKLLNEENYAIKVERADALNYKIQTVPSLILPGNLDLNDGSEELYKKENKPEKKIYNDCFTDVDKNFWAKSAIKYCYENNLIVGTSETTFSPEALMSVAEGITAAVRIAGGTVENGGKNWYDGVVEEAVRLGIIQNGQFDDYERPVTRGEMASFFVAAVSEDKLAEINNVELIPDADENTPYYQAIYKLYRAGILAGSDSAGNSKPYDDIKRCEIVTIMHRIMDDSIRVPFNMFAPLSDCTVYTTAYRIRNSQTASYGVYRIGNEYFVSEKALEDIINSGLHKYSFSANYSLGEYNTGHPMLDFSFAPVADRIVGTAQLLPECFEYNCKNYSAMYSIGGEYLMVNVKALGAQYQGDEIVFAEKRPSQSEPVVEADLVGNVLPSLQRATAEDTVRAIHDYIVNTLMYDPETSPPSNITDEMMNNVIYAKTVAYDMYKNKNNITLQSGYGVCQDYAELFCEMCTRSGIPCYVVSGYAGGGSHAWNKVYLNGKWSYVDTTWDDPVGNKQTLRYDYFLIDANTLVNSHYWDGNDYPMQEQYDPNWQYLDTNNITSADMFRKCLVAQMMMKNPKFSLRGVYGGTACIRKYDIYFYNMRWSYNSRTGAYDFEIMY